MVHRLSNCISDDDKSKRGKFSLAVAIPNPSYGNFETPNSMRILTYMCLADSDAIS